VVEGGEECKVELNEKNIGKMILEYMRAYGGYIRDVLGMYLGDNSEE
jgi:hypothetical protein